MKFDKISVGFFLLTFSSCLNLCFSQARLVCIKHFIPDCIVDLPYSTTNNFTGKILYSSNEAFLVEPAALSLASASKQILKHGYKLKILDAYRPLSVQSILWSCKPDSKFVAQPSIGSNHNRGASVDVTMVSVEDQKEAEMPSRYDEFGPQASAIGKNLPDHIKVNLAILQNAMLNNGFTLLKSEWWHFDHKSYFEHPILDIPFSELNCGE